MARSKPAEIGDNAGGLTDEERAALMTNFSIRIRQQRRKADEKKAAYDAERQEVNNLFALVKGELQISRKDFERILEEQEMSEAEFRAYIGKQRNLRVLAGLPVGEQIDLFNHVAKDTADEQAEAHANGYRAGSRGDDGIPPETLSPVLHQDWLAGWNEAQAEIGRKMALAAEVLARRGEPDAEAEAEDLGDDDEGPEPGTPEARKAEREAERRARESLEKMGAAEPEAVH